MLTRELAARARRMLQILLASRLRPWPRFYSGWQRLGWRFPEFSIGYDRYVRTNDMQMNIYSASLGFQL